VKGGALKSFGVGGICRVKISYDRAKRDKTLAERDLDFEDAVIVFGGPVIDVIDDRRDYGEARWATYGRLKQRLVVVVWTQRGGIRHIISMRKCNERERKIYEAQLD
jgi:uncharacterized DUF497 family protein